MFVTAALSQPQLSSTPQEYNVSTMVSQQDWCSLEESVSPSSEDTAETTLKV